MKIAQYEVSVRPVLAWYDLWVGAYIDLPKSRVYVMCLGVGVVVTWAATGER